MMSFIIVRIPLNVVERIKWIDAIQTHQIFENNSMMPYVCHLHFNPTNFNRSGKLVRNSIPSVFGQILQNEEFPQANQNRFKLFS